MPDLVPNTFPEKIAYDTNTGSTLKNAIADVYAMTDTGFTTPLPLTDPSGVPMAKLVSSNDGVFPEFIVDTVEEHIQVRAKSGSFVTTLVSFLGGRGPAGDVGPAGAGVPDTTVAVPGQALIWNGTSTSWGTVVGGSGIAGAPTAWPDAFPALQHSHTVTEITNASTVGRSVLTAADAQAARNAIGAGTGNGTSNLALGNTPTTAMPGNRVFGAQEVTTAFTSGPLAGATNVVQALELAAATGGSGGTAAQAGSRWVSGAYTALPATKPTGVLYWSFVGPVVPTIANTTGGFPSWLGNGPTQIPGKIELNGDMT